MQGAEQQSHQSSFRLSHEESEVRQILIAGRRVSKRHAKAPVFKIFWILKVCSLGLHNIGKNSYWDYFVFCYMLRCEKKKKTPVASSVDSVCTSKENGQYK